MFEIIYCNKLRVVGIALIINMAVSLLSQVIPWQALYAGAAFQLSMIALLRYFAGTAAGGLSLLAYRFKKRRAIILLISILVLCASLALSVVGRVRNADSLVDLNLFFQAVIIATLLQIGSSEEKWNRIKRAKARTLDLRLEGKRDLFNPLVMGPHLEINREIIRAVDHYLEISVKHVPLTLCFHTHGSISEPLQLLAQECYRMHYQDEERRIAHYLQSRYTRSVCMIGAGIIALHIMSAMPGHDETAVLWEIIGNFAAFSLWQAGDTFFERSDTMQGLLRALIAEHADIQFL